jgi:hypothetical protein
MSIKFRKTQTEIKTDFREDGVQYWKVRARYSKYFFLYGKWSCYTYLNKEEDAISLAKKWREFRVIRETN